MNIRIQKQMRAGHLLEFLMVKSGMKQLVLQKVRVMVILFPHLHQLLPLHHNQTMIMRISLLPKYILLLNLAVMNGWKFIMVMIVR